jgi:hypothetical protein
MSYLHSDPFDHMDEDEFFEDIDEQEDDFDVPVDVDEDAALDEYEMLTKVTDTSAAQARKGKDIQGIPWEILNITRQSYRLTRLEQYRNFENILTTGETFNKDCKQVDRHDEYYEFFYNTRMVKPTILHFQLRNLVWATSKHDVYLVSNYSIMHWSSLSGNLSEIINFNGHVAPTERCAGNLMEGFSQTQISTLAVNDNFLVAGGFQGELTCKRLDKKGVSFCTRTTHDDNAITNSIEIYESLRYFFINGFICLGFWNAV